MEQMDFSKFLRSPYLITALQESDAQKLLECGQLQYEDLETAAQVLLNAMYVNGASGAHLDVLGIILGVARQGRDDFNYATLLNLAAAVHTSSGTYDPLNTAIRILYKADNVLITPEFPAKVLVFHDGESRLTIPERALWDDDEEIELSDGELLDFAVPDDSGANLIEDLLPAGVGLVYVYQLITDAEEVIVTDTDDVIVIS